MNPALPLLGARVTATDFLFLSTVALWAATLAIGAMRWRWHPFFWLLLAYFAAMLVSAFFSTQPSRSWVKLATQAYLLFLPVLAYNMVDTGQEMARALRSWLAATALVAGLGIVTLLLFAAGVERSTLGYPMHHFGTLPPGPYPRLDLVFTHPAMLCNYLTVSLMILLVVGRSDRLSGPALRMLLAALLLSAVFTITPGFGGILLALGVWLWLYLRARFQLAAVASLGLGLAAAFLFVLSAAVTPIIHPTAPFLIDVPGLAEPLAPSARLLFWIDAVERFLQHSLVGTGIGTDAVSVAYRNPSGYLGRWTDAHNVYLSIAVQCGSLGLAALIALITAVAVRTTPLRFGEPGSVVRIGLGLAWLNAFAYQGLTGAYEDARHLWVLLGMFLASASLPPDGKTLGVASGRPER